MHRSPRVWWALSLAMLAWAWAGATHADEAQFEDIESRIDYAWFTEDTNALRSLIQTARALSQKGADSADLRYLLALANYRIGLLLAAAKPPDAMAAMNQCVDEGGKVLDLQNTAAEAYALQAICYTELARLHSWKTMVNAPLAALKMERALKLAPNNPRVVLIDGARSYAEAKGGDKAAALTRFRRALELFEDPAEGAPQAAEPSWGYADTYTYIGRILQEKGDLLGARNAYERALIIAPDFAAARRELQALLRS